MKVLLLWNLKNFFEKEWLENALKIEILEKYTRVKSSNIFFYFLGENKLQNEYCKGICWIWNKGILRTSI